MVSTLCQSDDREFVALWLTGISVNTNSFYNYLGFPFSGWFRLASSVKLFSTSLTWKQQKNTLGKMIKANSLTFNSGLIRQKFSTALINSCHFISVRNTKKSLFAFFSSFNNKLPDELNLCAWEIPGLWLLFGMQKIRWTFILLSYEVIHFFFSETLFECEMLSQEMHIFNCPVIIAFIHKSEWITHILLYIATG